MKVIYTSSVRSLIYWNNDYSFWYDYFPYYFLITLSFSQINPNQPQQQPEESQHHFEDHQKSFDRLRLRAGRALHAVAAKKRSSASVVGIGTLSSTSGIASFVIVIWVVFVEEESLHSQLVLQGRLKLSQLLDSWNLTGLRDGTKKSNEKEDLKIK